MLLQREKGATREENIKKLELRESKYVLFSGFSWRKYHFIVLVFVFTHFYVFVVDDSANFHQLRNIS